MILEKKKIEKLKSKFSKATRNESKFCLKCLGRETEREIKDGFEGGGLWLVGIAFVDSAT